MNTIALLAVLWTAASPTDFDLGQAEPIEGMPAAECEAAAANLNRTSETYWFCTPEEALHETP